MQGTQKSESLELFAPARRAPRFVPVQSITAAVLDQGLPSAYAIVTNISESGACVQTGEVCTRRDIHMVLSFVDGTMLEASGRVVWSKSLEVDGSQALCGIEFKGLSDGNREALRTVLHSTAFAAPDS